MSFFEASFATRGADHDATAATAENVQKRKSWRNAAAISGISRVAARHFRPCAIGAICGFTSDRIIGFWQSNKTSIYNHLRESLIPPAIAYTGSIGYQQIIEGAEGGRLRP